MNFFRSLDPRTILAVFSFTLTCAFLLSANIVQDLFFILYLFVILLIIKQFKFVFVWSFILLILHLLLFLDPNAAPQFHFLALIIRKMCLLFSTGRIIYAIISVSDCVNLMKKLRFSKNIIIPIAICFRFIPTLIFEAAIIRDALKIRKRFSLKQLFFHPMSTFELFLTTFLFRTYALSEELFYSLSTRGLNLSFTQFYRDISFKLHDLLFLICTLFVIALIHFYPLWKI